MTKEFSNGIQAKEVTVPPTVVDADFTGHITIETKTVKVTGPAVTNWNGFMMIVFSGGTGYVFEKSSTAAAKGYPISSSSPVYLTNENLADLAFDADTDGTVIAFRKV